MGEPSIPTAGLMLGLATAGTYGMILAVVVGAPYPLLLGPLGAGIGWWLGRRRQGRVLVEEAEHFLGEDPGGH